MISQEYLKLVLTYIPEWGIFIWKVKPSKSINVGDVAGSLDGEYIRITINGVRYLAHRLAWFYVTGRWPENDIDHKDLNKTNNKWLNLREADDSRNKANIERHSDNTSGVKGVHWDKDRKLWRASIGFNGKNIKIGRFETKEEAAQAYENKAIELFGIYARADSDV